MSLDRTPPPTTQDDGAPVAFYDLASGTVRFRQRDTSAANVSEILNALLGGDTSETNEGRPE